MKDYGYRLWNFFIFIEQFYVQVINFWKYSIKIECKYMHIM